MCDQATHDFNGHLGSGTELGRGIRRKGKKIFLARSGARLPSGFEEISPVLEARVFVVMFTH
jgi:hypothetical protein